MNRRSFFGLLLAPLLAPFLVKQPSHPLYKVEVPVLARDLQRQTISQEQKDGTWVTIAELKSGIEFPELTRKAVFPVTFHKEPWNET